MRSRSTLAALLACGAMAVGCGAEGPVSSPAPTVPPGPDAEAPPTSAGAVPSFSRVPDLSVASDLGPFGEEGFARWRTEAPWSRDVRITSSVDGTEQPAFWQPPPPSAQGERPLLVALHSWGNRYDQHVNVPFARWARRNGWAMVSPNFRGRNDSPDATGSDRAVGDVGDAVDYAIERGDVDEDRVFAIGFSGGGMMSLLAAGRLSERFAGVAAWVPVHDLGDWYRYNAGRQPPPDYAEEIVTSCGGDPSRRAAARRECRRRSPSAHLERAREAGVPVYLGHGLQDTLVPPDHALRAFNQLADRDDRIGAASLRRVAENDLPAHLDGAVDTETYFDARRDPEVRFARRSGSVTAVLFEGEHDMVYHPALEWMTELIERE